MSIDAGAQVTIIILACGPCMVIVNLLGQVCTLGRAPRTKETLPDFHEWCRVTRHPRIFRRLTGCQWTTRFWGVTFGIRAKVNDYLGSSVCNTPKYTLVIFDMFREFCKHNLNFL